MLQAAKKHPECKGMNQVDVLAGQKAEVLIIGAGLYFTHSLLMTSFGNHFENHLKINFILF